MVTVITNLGDEPLVATEKSPLVISQTATGGPRSDPLIRAGPGKADEPETFPAGNSASALPSAELQIRRARSNRTARSASTIARQGEIDVHRRPDEVTVEGAGGQRSPVVQDAVASAKAQRPSASNASNWRPKRKAATTDLSAAPHPFALTDTLELNQILKTSGNGNQSREHRRW